MLGLPVSTEFNKRIPKQKFYENAKISPKLKKIFSDEIKAIYWRNKIAPSTLNIEEGKNVKEIEIIEIKLNSKNIDEQVLRIIDKNIPYHIVFGLEYDGEYQLYVSYKEINNRLVKLVSYYHNDWSNNEITLEINGINVESIYESFVRQIAGNDLNKKNEEETLNETINREERNKEINKKITLLQTKLKKEKQLNKKIEINKDIKELKEEFERYS